MMNRKQRISNLFDKNFKNFVFEIIDNSHLHSGHNNFDGKNETHILIKLSPKIKGNLNRLEIHRNINNILKDEFNNGLHSIEIKIT